MTSSRFLALFLISLLACGDDLAPDEPSNEGEATLTTEWRAPLRTPIIRPSDPSAPTHYLRVGQVTVGVSANGGGYVNYFNAGDGEGNIVSPGYGRGWQSSIRDALHNGRYNPTQAGFIDPVGAPVEVTKPNLRRLVIPPFQMPLFMDPVYDFTQHQDLARDIFCLRDSSRCGTDRDGLPEGGQSQDGEVRSEFDFDGSYEDVSAQVAEPGVSVLLHMNRYTYARSPNAILQFGPSARMEEPAADGDTRVYLPERVKGDVSAVLPGQQIPGPTDLSEVYFVGLGIRIWAGKGYDHAMWYAGQRWNAVHVSTLATGSRIKGFDPDQLDEPLLMYSAGSDPTRSKAIALFSPKSQRNTNQTIGRALSNGTIAYSENRCTMSRLFLTSNPLGGQEQLGIRNWYSLRGLMAPNRAKPGHVEGVRHESYVLYGTPASILRAAKKLHN